MSWSVCLVHFKGTINVRCKHHTHILTLPSAIPFRGSRTVWGMASIWPDSELELQPYCKEAAYLEEIWTLNWILFRDGDHSLIEKKGQKEKSGSGKSFEVEIQAGKIFGICTRINTLQKGRKSSQANLRFTRKDNLPRINNFSLIPF